MHCYNYLCQNFLEQQSLNTEQSTYINLQDSTVSYSYGDSLLNCYLPFSEKDTFYLSMKVSSEVEQTGHIGTKRPFTLEGDDGIFALLLICFVFFTGIYRGGLTFFKENIRSFFSLRRNSNSLNQATTTDFWFNFVLVFQMILLTSIILFDFFLESNGNYVPPHSFYTIILFIFTISVFLLLKYLVYKLIGFLFNIEDIISVWLRNYILILEMIGIIAFIPVLVLVYSQNLHEYLLIFFIVLFIVSRLLLFYRIITFFLEQHVNILFLIAYLCSVEIIPYVILYQILSNLYKIDIISLLWH